MQTYFRDFCSHISMLSRPVINCGWHTVHQSYYSRKKMLECSVAFAQTILDFFVSTKCFRIFLVIGILCEVYSRKKIASSKLIHFVFYICSVSNSEDYVFVVFSIEMLNFYLNKLFLSA